MFITFGYIGYKYDKSNQINSNNNINNDINDGIDEEKYNISKLSKEEARDTIKNSNKVEDFICSIPEYSDEDYSGVKGVNYVYCYLKYNRLDNDDFL